MKTHLSISLVALATITLLPASVTITVSNFTPNGINSGGTGSGSGAFTSTLGDEATDNGMPVTTYTITNVDLSSVGGSANESFIFTVSYSQTGGSGVQFNGFGNVSVTGGDNAQVGNNETLTASIALTSSTFADLSLTGLTVVRGGGVAGADTGTFTHAGGTENISAGSSEATVTGTSVTLAVTNGAINFEGFRAEFVAVPEPASGSLIGLGAILLVRRRKCA